MEDLKDNVQPEVTDTDEIDEAMLAMSEFVVQMSDVEGYLVDEEMMTSMQLEKVGLSIPIQLDLHVRDDGTVRLGCSPPLYYAATTILPVFHQLNINIKLTENTRNDAGSSE
jgi:hypothetical protein